ncbi:MAG: A/G-specific adenine glycosylase, partial [Enterocloster sp.]|nr:A/G-specific adenine glycosylase [Enterocloster sp.]
MCDGRLHFYDRLQILEEKDRSLEQRERLRAVEKPLLAWYASRARKLPWREDPKPYRVWISEIMLQQTRVEAVKPYFERFMTALPTIRDLAEAPEDVILKLWEGLGYYNRVRNMQKAARKLVAEYDGQMPADFDAILELPGIGSYTAGAIASIAFGLPYPAVDGNVLRVLSRIEKSYD